MGKSTGSVNVGFDNGNTKAVLLSVPFGEFRRGRRLSLTVKTHKEEGRTSRLKLRGRAEDTHQFGVEDVHGMRLHGQSRPRLFLSHPRF